MAAGSMDSAGNSGRNDDLYSTFNLDYGNIIMGGYQSTKLDPNHRSILPASA